MNRPRHNSPVSAYVPALILSLLPLASLIADETVGRISIHSPGRNAVITTSSVYVAGTAVARSRNIGVVVNGVAAEIDFDHAGTGADPFRWFAEVIDAPAGRVKLKARLTTPKSSNSGKEDDDAANGPASIQFIEHAPPELYAHIEGTPRNGIAPLTVRFDVTIPESSRVEGFEIDYDGNGSWDITSPTVPDDLSFTYQTPGLRIVSARLTLDDGSELRLMTAVAPQSFATLDGMLREVWRDFRNVLVARDVDGALSFFAGDNSRAKYREPLTLIRQDLPDFASGLQTINAISIRGGIAHYLLRRTEAGRVKGYHVYFTRDGNGLWKISQL